MSLLTPIKMPVKMYKSTDAGAPTIAGAGSMMNIFKACLVTGYGTKDGAGWTMPFENTTTKVFRPEVGIETDFYLQCTADNGSQVKTKVYSDMTAADTGTLMMETETAFVHGFAGSRKWVLLATTRCVWIFIDTNGTRGSNNWGAYFTVGDTGFSSDAKKLLFYKHTGGTWGLGDFERGTILEDGYPSYGGVHARIYDPVNGVRTITQAGMTSFFNGITNSTKNPIGSQIFIKADADLYEIPLLASSNSVVLNNLDEVQSTDGSFLAVSTGLRDGNMFLIATDFWIG